MTTKQLLNETKERKQSTSTDAMSLQKNIIIRIINQTGQSFHGNDKRKQYRTAPRKRNLKFSSNQSHPDK